MVVAGSGRLIGEGFEGVPLRTGETVLVPAKLCAGARFVGAEGTRVLRTTVRGG